MDHYVSKPVHAEVLERVLDFWTVRWAAVHDEEQPTGATAKPQKIFDREEFLERKMNNELLAKRVARVFVRDVPMQLAALSAALREADTERVRVTAHSLKGAAANMGGAGVRATAQQMEKLGAEGDVSAAERLLPELVSQAEKLSAAVEHFHGSSSE